MSVTGGPGSGSADVQLMNQNTGQQYTAPLTAPEGTILQGINVEWIVERVEGNLNDGNGNDFTGPLPNFGTVTFTDTYADAVSSDGTNVQSFDASTASLLNLVNDDGETLTSASLSGSNVDVTFEQAE